MLPRLRLMLEGRTELFVPLESLRKRTPDTHPVFFNPAGRTNRDISVAVAASARPRTFLDALAGVGARGVRVANEGSRRTHVTMVDFNELSLGVARRNARRNEVRDRCELVHSEANRYLFSRYGRDERFEAVDIDPFGSPAQLVQGGVSATADGGILSLTATDTAVLCGVHPAVAWRRYGALVPRSEFVHETGIRALAAFCTRLAGTADAAAVPVAAHSTLHYMRLFVRIERGAARADKAMHQLGYVSQCGECHSRSVDARPPDACPACNARVKPAGPVWCGPLVDDVLVSDAARRCDKSGNGEGGSVLASLLGVNQLPPFAYSLERICAREKLASVSLSGTIAALRKSGYGAMRDPFQTLALKTDAPYATVVSSVRGSRNVPGADQVHL